MKNNTPKASEDGEESWEDTSIDIDSLSAFEKEIINKSLLDIQEGRVHSHAAVMKQAAEWLREK